MGSGIGSDEASAWGGDGGSNASMSRSTLLLPGVGEDSAWGGDGGGDGGVGEGGGGEGGGEGGGGDGGGKPRHSHA